MYDLDICIFFVRVKLATIFDFSVSIVTLFAIARNIPKITAYPLCVVLLLVKLTVNATSCSSKLLSALCAWDHEHLNTRSKSSYP